ncbi:mechanosensitive ion channel family protein [Candidatus Saccharibacteria bacterium]|nr:mechanosensitive ion channel family protein [Candidatus Saccharibacteria bacterium]
MSKTAKVFSTKKRKTYLRMLKSFVCAAILIIVVLTVLQLLGVNVSSMLAGVGIASIIIGFALQDALKDIFRGLEIVADDYYDIGDVIKYGDNMGQVTSINLRTTKMQDMNTMNIVSIANRNIDQVEIVSGYIYIPIPLPHSIKVEKAEEIMKEIVKGLSKQALLTSAAYQGVTDLTNSSINYQVVVTCDPMDKLQARRDSLRVILTTLEDYKISIPYTQLDVHTKA